jgi:hypothetical protein
MSNGVLTSVVVTDERRCCFARTFLVLWAEGDRQNGIVLAALLCGEFLGSLSVGSFGDEPVRTKG